jgi:hypothetical protein
MLRAYVPQDDSVDFLFCLIPLVAIHALLGTALFMDAFAPVMKAKAKAAQLKSQEAASKVGNKLM